MNMYKIRLVSMPFAHLASPSIALTQLKAVTKERFSEAVSVEIIYLLQDFASFVGASTFSYISGSMTAFYAGFGDWFFREVAFPELPDNTEKYMRRYFWGKNPETQKIKALVAEKRPML